MPILHRYPRAACTNVPSAAPDLNTAFPPGQFVLGEWLFVRDQNALWVRTIDAGNAPIWFAVSGGGSAVASGDLAPMRFAGGVPSGNLSTTAAGGFLANNPGSSSTDYQPLATPLHHIKPLSGMISVRPARLTVWPSVNSFPGVGTTISISVQRHSGGVTTALTPTLTLAGGVTGAASFVDLNPVTITPLDQFDLAILIAHPELGEPAALVISAELTFAQV